MRMGRGGCILNMSQQSSTLILSDRSGPSHSSAAECDILFRDESSRARSKPGTVP
jgi:hypothetical protein